jgi:integrase
MAAIQKRLNKDGTVSFRVLVRKQGHPTVTRTFKTRTHAKQWAQRVEVRLVEDGDFPSRESQRTTLAEGLARVLAEQTPRKKGWEREATRITRWMKHPLAQRSLMQLRSADFAAYRDERRRAGKAENTIRNELSIIGRLYELARREWNMPELRNPVRGITMPGHSRERSRRLQPGEEQGLLAELARHGPYMAPLVAFAVESALRKSELLGLTWADVDLHKRVAKLYHTKNGTDRDVPLSSRAVEILRALPRPLDAAAPVFPLTAAVIYKHWIAACAACGIEDLRVHDLRHEAVSRISERLPMHETMRVSGHKTASQLLRYYHPRAEDLAKKLG